MRTVSHPPEPINPDFRVVRDQLSDGSIAYNVEGWGLTFGVIDRGSARALALHLNRCAWVEGTAEGGAK